MHLFCVCLIDQSQPTDVAVKVINALAVDVIWQKAIGNISGYRIKYFTKGNKIISKEVKADDQHAVITNLTPGETYTFCVVSVSGRVESNEAPPGGIPVTLRNYMVLTEIMVFIKCLLRVH